MKSAYKLIYGYLAVTYSMLFLGVLVSDTLYVERGRILCASSVERYVVNNIMNVPTFVPWLLFGLMIAGSFVCGYFLKQFTLGIGLSNCALGLYTLVIYARELKHFFPFSMTQPTVRSAFLVIGSYLIVLISLVMVPMILLSKDDDELDKFFLK